MHGWNFVALVVGGAVLVAVVSYVVTRRGMRPVRTSTLAMAITCAGCGQRNTAGATICRVCDLPLVAPAAEEDIAVGDDRVTDPERPELMQDLSPEARNRIRRY